MAQRVKNSPRQEFDPLVGKIPWRRKWQHIPVFFSEKKKPHGQSLASYGPKGHKQLGMTKWLSTHTAVNAVLRAQYVEVSIYPLFFYFYKQVSFNQIFVYPLDF